MNVDEVLDTVEQSLLSRQLSSLERLILCQSWLGRGYSEMAADCAYSIAHIKEIGSQLWQALSKTLGERVTKKNLFLVLKQYLLSRTGETVNSDELPVTFSLVEVTESPLTPTTNQLPVITDSVEASYSGDSEQLSLICDRGFLVTQESSQLERGQQKCQNSTDNNDLKKPLLGASHRYERSTVMTARLLWAIAKRCQIGSIVVLMNLPTFPMRFTRVFLQVGLVELRQHFNPGLLEIIRPFFFTIISRLN